MKNARDPLGREEFGTHTGTVLAGSEAVLPPSDATTAIGRPTCRTSPRLHLGEHRLEGRNERNEIDQSIRRGDEHNDGEREVC